MSAEPLPRPPPDLIVRAGLWVRRTIQALADALTPPELVMLEHMSGVMRTKLIGAAARLDLAEHLARGPLGAPELAARYPFTSEHALSGPGGHVWSRLPGSGLRSDVADFGAHHLDFTGAPWNETDDGAHQHRLAAAGRADQAEDFAAANVQRQTVDHDLPAEADHEVMHANREFGEVLRHRYIPIEAKNTANRPSSTITRKIDFTTDVVVCLPSDSALPFTRRPSLQATMPITSAMNGALRMPTSK